QDEGNDAALPFGAAGETDRGDDAAVADLLQNFAEQASADIVDAAGPALLVEYLAGGIQHLLARHDGGGAESDELVSQLGPAGERRDPVTQPRQQHDSDRANPAARAGDENFAILGPHTLGLHAADQIGRASCREGGTRSA